MYYLSIITVSFNDKDALLRTMNSILPIPNNCEWIIVDADSQDGTKDILNNLPKQKNIIWISEKDNGLYDGMNKGVHLASGRYLNFMNAGDMFVRDSLELINNKQSNESDILIFDYIPLDNELGLAHSRSFKTNISFIKNYDCIPHQSTLISKKLFENIGSYDLNFKYAADYDFFSKAYIGGYSYSFDSAIKLAYFVQDGVSSNLRNSLKIAIECKKIQYQYFQKYSKKLFLIYILKYALSFVPFSSKFFSILRIIFFKKRK